MHIILFEDTPFIRHFSIPFFFIRATFRHVNIVQLDHAGIPYHSSIFLRSGNRWITSQMNWRRGDSVFLSKGVASATCMVQ